MCAGDVANGSFCARESGSKPTLIEQVLPLIKNLLCGSWEQPGDSRPHLPKASVKKFWERFHT